MLGATACRLSCRPKRLTYPGARAAHRRPLDCGGHGIAAAASDAAQDLTYGDFLAFFATTRRLLPERPYRHFVMEFSELFDLQVRRAGLTFRPGTV